MNITELDSYNLADAVKFNDQLNPRLWDASEHLRPEVRDHLLQIADDFRESLGVTDLELKDITISGSNAAYTYTPHSDIDLHLVVDLPTADHNEVYRELFDAKKYQYNDEHNIRIGNADVELYVENANQPPKSQGIYSILQNKWLQVPRRGRADIDDNSTKNKYQTLSRQIQSAIKSGSVQKISNLVTKIRKMRQTSLDQHGEFGAENLAFKILRSQGAIDQLYAARNQARDQELSLAEQVPKQPFVYGFKQVHEASTPDGVSPQTKMFLSEEPPADDETVLQDFVDFCVQELQIDSPPTIKLRRDPQWSVVHRTFGRYTNDRNRLEVAWGQRHIMDVLRTVAHELTHRHQHERDGSRMGPDAGETGSPYENEANAQAGVLMRNYGRLHPELFDSGQEELNEGLSNNMSTEDMIAYLRQHHDTNLHQDYLDHINTFNKFVLQNIPVNSIKTDLPKLDRAKVEQYKQMDFSKAPPIVMGGGYILDGYHRANVAKALGIPTIRAYVGVQSQQGIAEGSEQSLSSMVSQDQAERNEYQQFVKSQAGGDWTKGAKMYAQLKKRPANDIFDDASRLNQFMKMTFDFDKFTNADWDNYWLLAQHCDSNRDFQKQALATIKKYQGPDHSHYKYLYDRISVGLTGKQKYGTQNIQQGVAEQQPDPQRREPQNESASGYIPTKRQARDPRYSMALSVDIHPGQVGKEANKLKLKTDRQGRPQIARADGLFEQLIMELEQFQTLDEVRMAPADLKRFAASPAAEGIRAGFEAELVFTGRGEPELEMEPDYHYDERAYSISQVIEFFSNDEAGLGMSQNRANRLERELDESYMEWHDEQLRSEFQDEQHSLIRDAKLARMDMDERILNVLTETDGFTEEEADAIVDLHWQQTRQGLKGSEMTDQQIDWRSKYNEAKRTAEAVLEDEVQESIDSNDDIYQQVLDEFRNSFELDDSNFFSDIGLRYMSDVANNYNLSWPYITQTGGEGGWSDENAKILADSLAKKLGVTTRASTNYHSAARDDSTWILEPDTSLEPDDESNMAIEIITPPMPLAECLTKMEQFFAWADSMGAYANESTGFHMGVSLPDDKNAGVDFTKLVLFLGDEHVLKQFERDANTYCRSAMQKIRNRVEHHPERAGDALNLMRNHMMELAHRTIVDNSGFGKYTSVNPKGNYIEFRSAGNTNYFEDIDQLKNTLLRYARAMSIASDPAAERKEYGKKLYKLLAPSRPDPAMALFSKFAAGELSQDELKTQWAELALIKEKNKELEWEAYDPVTGLVLGTAQGSDPSKILSYFTNTMNLNNFKVRTKQSKPSARSELANRIIQQLGPDKPGNWFFYRDGRYLGQIDGTKGQAEAERKKWALNLGINVNQVIMTKSPDSIRGQLGEPRPAFASQTPREPPPNPTPRSRWPFDEPESQPDVAQNFPDTQLTVQGVPNWELYDRRTNEVVRTFFQRDSTSALNYATQWLNTNRPGVPLGNFNVRPTPATNESVGLTESARWPDIESAKRAFVANPRLQHLPVSKRSAMGAAAYLKQQSSSGDLISKLKTPPAKSWQDVDETINNAMFQGSWEKQEHRDGLDLKAEASTRSLSIRAYDADGRMIGQAHFDIVDDHLESFDTYVDRRYRRQGVATAMYNWAKELGNDIVASPDRLPDGKKFWTGSRRGTKTWENYEI